MANQVKPDTVDGLVSFIRANFQTYAQRKRYSPEVAELHRQAAELGRKAEKAFGRQDYEQCNALLDEALEIAPAF